MKISLNFIRCSLTYLLVLRYYKNKLFFQKKESLHRRKELAESRLIWEKKLRGEEERKVKKLRTLEEELLQKQEQQDAIIKLNIEKQVMLYFVFDVIARNYELSDDVSSIT